MTRAELQNTRQILKSMSDWKINASNEDMRKYFFAFDDFSRIQDGEFSLILGRRAPVKRLSVNISTTNPLRISVLS